MLCYVITMPNQRTIYLYINIYAHLNTKGILTPLRRPVGRTEYLAVLDCGRVPINNLDPVIRVKISHILIVQTYLFSLYKEENTRGPISESKS